MVEVIEVHGWSNLSERFVIDVISLDDLKKIAKITGIHLIFHRRQEYIIMCDTGSAIHFYRFKARARASGENSASDASARVY